MQIDNNSIQFDRLKHVYTLFRPQQAIKRNIETFTSSNDKLIIHIDHL